MVATLIQLATDPVIRAWTGQTDLTHDGETWTGGGSAIRLEGVGSSDGGGVVTRLTLAAIPGEHRGAFLGALGPVTVTIILVTSDDGQTWTERARRVGVLGDSTLAGDLFSFTVAGPDADARRHAPVQWSHNEQRRRDPGDRGLEQMAALAAGIPATWPAL